MEENKIVDAAQPTADKDAGASAPANRDHRQARPNNGPRKDGDKRNDRRSGGRRFEREPKEFEERVVQINRISKTVMGGRRMRFSALVVVGNGKGKYGFGAAKAAEVPDAIKKAIAVAEKNTFTVPFVKGNTIPHIVIGKFGASQVYLKPAPEGTGVIAGGSVRAILELAGIKNIYSKVYGSRTPINAVRATVNGLNNLKTFASVKGLRK